MIKAGILGSIVGFVYIMSLTLMSPFCTLCFTPFLGIGIGYLAGRLDHPKTLEASFGRGSIAGGITGLGAVLGQMSAAVVNAILITNSAQLPIFIQELGLSELVPPTAAEYWQTTLTYNSFCSLFNLGSAIFLGTLGSSIWFQRNISRSHQ